jgi:class 3 adenylate cyclase
MATFQHLLDQPVGETSTNGTPSAVSEPALCRRLLLTLLFTDIVGSTQIAERLGDDAWFALLNRHRAIVRAQLARQGGREVDSCGDSFFAIFPGPARAVRCAEDICRALEGTGIEIRAGIHAGECDFSGDRVSGIAVHVAARIAALARPKEVLVSDTVKDLVAGSGLSFSDRGRHGLKGLGGLRRLFAVGAQAQNAAAALTTSPVGAQTARVYRVF